jgi:hypothetical protein
MQIFLTNRPGEHGLKQTARAIDTALCAAHAHMADNVADGLQRIAFLLGELRGLLASAPTYAGLGIRVRRPTLLAHVGTCWHMSALYDRS